MNQQSFCHGCGHGARPGDAFCRSCGVQLDETPGDAHPLEAARVSAGRGQLAEAIASIEGLLATDPSATHLTALATLYIRKGDPIAAERELRRAIAADPGYGVAQAYLGSLLIQLGDIAQGEALLDQAVASSPSEILVTIKRAEYWLSVGVLERASAELSVALREQGGTPAERELARLLLEQAAKRRRGSFVRGIVPLGRLFGRPKRMAKPRAALVQAVEQEVV